MTKTAVEYVTVLTIQEMLQHKTPEQIALQWNAGNAKKCSKGINKLGVPYNSCEYVEKTIRNFNQLQ
jgi:hypothetical protein